MLIVRKGKIDDCKGCFVCRNFVFVKCVDVVFQVLCHAAKVFFGKNFQRVVKHLRVLLQEFCTSLFEQIEIFVCVYVMEI